VEDKLSKIKTEYSGEISQTKSLKELDVLFLRLFGKNGEITLFPKNFSKLSKDELKVIGPLFNLIKLDLEKEIESKRSLIREESYKNLEKETLNLDSGQARMTERKGHLHLATQFKKEIVDLFAKLGFEQFDAPHLEEDKYNFEFLNIPKNHPSRDMWDTLYIDVKNLKVEPGSMLLRTHTSNFWPRLMEKAAPATPNSLGLHGGRGKTPIRAMSFDRCFRYEAVDARHSHTFNQFDIAVVGENITMANLKYLTDYFLKAILGKEAKSRFRPKYYPFVEPGVGIDSLCVFCHGKGCKICSGTGWFEIAGAGMIHPNVFKATGLDPKKYTGLAWGFGPDRMLMLKHEIKDIRYLLEGDLKFLENY